jgi:hypothetical protein
MLDCRIEAGTELCQMGFQRPTLRLIAGTVSTLAMIGALGACGDPKGQSPPIEVTFSPTYQIPASLTTGSTTGIEALVANDNQNAGVTLTCTPDTPAGECGGFTPPAAGSNVPSCYRAPADVPGGDGTVTLTATSVTDATKSVSSTPITIVSGAAVVTCMP